MATQIIFADELTVGMQVAAEDGYLFDVRAVEVQGDVVSLTIGSDFSPDARTRAGLKVEISADDMVTVA